MCAFVHVTCELHACVHLCMLLTKCLVVCICAGYLPAAYLCAFVHVTCQLLTCVHLCMLLVNCLSVCTCASYLGTAYLCANPPWPLTAFFCLSQQVAMPSFSNTRIHVKNLDYHVKKWASLIAHSFLSLQVNTQVVFAHLSINQFKGSM